MTLVPLMHGVPWQICGLMLIRSRQSISSSPVPVWRVNPILHSRQRISAIVPWPATEISPDTGSVHAKFETLPESPTPHFKRIRIKELLMLVVMLGSFPFLGCGNPGEGMVHVAAGARHLGPDPVTKQRLDAEKYKPKTAPVPVERGKLRPRPDVGLNTYSGCEARCLAGGKFSGLLLPGAMTPPSGLDST